MNKFVIDFCRNISAAQQIALHASKIKNSEY